MDLKWVPFEPDSNPKYDSSDVWGSNVEVFPRGFGVPLLSGKKKVTYLSDIVPRNVNMTQQYPISEKHEKVKLMDELWWIFQFQAYYHCRLLHINFESLTFLLEFVVKTFTAIE